jgi:uncharacterized protein YbaR (Trm112 family)
MPTDPAAIFRCPKCSTEVVFDSESALCRNEDCRLAYPISRGIPEMLLDHSQELSPEDWIRRIAAAE